MRPGPEVSVERLALLAEVQAEPMVGALLAAGGAMWIAVYLIVIARGFKDEACGMPLVALAVNFSWELMWGVVIPDKPPMDTINQVWAGIDLIIVLQYLRWGRRDFPAHAPRSWFVPMVLGTFAAAMAFIYFGTYEFRDWEVGGAYIAYLDNVMMSALFLHWAMTRDHVLGQSMWVAVLKGVGTATLSVAGLRINEAVLGGSPFLSTMFVLCGVLDAAYIVLLYRRMRLLGITHPFRRL
ncbi:MAG: hypothetical protein KDA24_18620 [Deltaproteobacteria bacterium]|nr:hypothetical protein [Deltaproteobacteria bacterium]